MPRIRSLSLSLLALAFCCANAALAQSPQVHVTVVPDTRAIQPGKPFHLAFTVTPEPGWHIYWQNPGDSGLPTKVAWTLPHGFSAGELQFPIPHQFTLPGNIIAYGYEGPTTFLATITPPKDPYPSGYVSIAGTVAWLCCKEECVPGQKAFSVILPVAQEALPANESLFKEAQSHLPADAPWVAQQAAAKPDITKTPDGEIVTLHLGLPALPCEMFPTLAPDLTISDITTTPTPAGNDIRFNLRPLAGQQQRTQHLPVLIVYPTAAPDHPSATSTGNNNATAFYLDVNLSGPAPVARP